MDPRATKEERKVALLRAKEHGLDLVEVAKLTVDLVMNETFMVSPFRSTSSSPLLLTFFHLAFASSEPVYAWTRRSRTRCHRLLDSSHRRRSRLGSDSIPRMVDRQRGNVPRGSDPGQQPRSILPRCVSFPSFLCLTFQLTVLCSFSFLEQPTERSTPPKNSSSSSLNNSTTTRPRHPPPTTTRSPVKRRSTCSM